MLYDFLSYELGTLYCDSVSIREIIAEVGTPVYIYNLKRALENLARIRAAFAPLDAHIHYSVKANANLSVLKQLIDAGCGD